MEENSKLMPCKVCGKEISKTAKVCPNCGESHEKIEEVKEIDNNAYRQSTSVFSSPLLLLLIVLIIFSGFSNESLSTSDAISATLFGFSVLVILLWYNSTNTMILQGDKLSYITGILSKHRQDLNINKISTISVDQTIIQRMFSVGDLRIYTTGDKPEIIAKGFRYPNKIKNMLLDR